MSELLHDYDPVKRHEYYLRNRKLKGRKKKALPVLAKKPPAVKQKTAAQRQKELEAQVARLQAKFKRLQEALRVLVEAAQKRNGIDKNSAEKAAMDKYKKQETADPTSKYESRKKTHAQEVAAKKAAEKYRDEHRGLQEQVSDLNKKIKAIRERIKRIQRTGSVGASTSTKR